MRLFSINLRTAIMFKDSSTGPKRKNRDFKLSKRPVVDLLLSRRKTHGVNGMSIRDFSMLSSKV